MVKIRFCGVGQLAATVILMALVTVGCGDSDVPEQAKPVDVIYQSADGFELLQLAESVESAHPYANDLDGTLHHRVHAPSGTVEFRVFFEQLEVENGYDQVQLVGPDGAVAQTLSGKFRGWTRSVQGDYVDLSIVSDSSVTRYGFSVSAIQFRMPDAPGGLWSALDLGPDAVETAHNYGNNTRRKWTLSAPEGAQRVRARFENFDTESGYDFVYIYDGRGAQVATYTGRRGDFTSVEVDGAVMTVELVTDYSETRYGFDLGILEYLAGDDASGCRSDSECGDGRICQQVHCIRAPCPAQCVPAPVAGGNGLCEPGACPSGASCSANLAGPGGVCAVPSWDRDYALVRPIATDHPYADDTVSTYDVRFDPWVERYSLDFVGFDVEASYDFAYFYQDGNGHPDTSLATATWTGKLDDFQTEVFDGRYGVLELVSDGSVTGRGFEVPSAEVYGLPTGLVGVYFEPAQCVEASRNPRTAEALRDLLDLHGISTFAITRMDVERDATCRACACPAGERFTVAMLPSDAVRFLTTVPVPNKGLISADGVAAVDGVVEVTGSPVQCAGNPWQVWWREHRDGVDADEQTMLAAYFDAEFGVELLFSWSRDTAMAVCRACSCPRGDILHVAFKGADGVSEKLEAAGWAP